MKNSWKYQVHSTSGQSKGQNSITRTPIPLASEELGRFAKALRRTDFIEAFVHLKGC